MLLMVSGLVYFDLQSPGWTNENAEVPPYRHELQVDLQLPAGFLAAGQAAALGIQVGAPVRIEALTRPLQPARP